MEIKMTVNVPVDVAIEVLKDAGCLVAGGLSKEQYKELEDKCDLRSMTYHPITVDDAIEAINNQFDANGGTLREDQAEELYHVLEDNPMTFAELADHCWAEKDTLAFLKTRFGGKVLQDKESILANIAEFLETNL